VPARSASLATARRRTTPAAIATPAAEVAGLLLVEVPGQPAGAGGCAQPGTIAGGWMAGRRPPAWAGVEVTTRQVTVVQHADASVLVHRVETALVVRTRAWPAVRSPPTMSNLRAARDNSGKRTPS
jgi:hypothetical protein